MEKYEKGKGYIPSFWQAVTTEQAHGGGKLGTLPRTRKRAGFRGFLLEIPEPSGTTLEQSTHRHREQIIIITHDCSMLKWLHPSKSKINKTKNKIKKNKNTYHHIIQL